MAEVCILKRPDMAWKRASVTCVRHTGPHSRSHGSVDCITTLVHDMGRSRTLAVNKCDGVAHKSLRVRNEQKSEVMREALLLQMVSHPNIVRYVDHTLKDGRFRLTMELVPGSDLCDTLSHGIIWSEAVSIAQQLGSALVYLHSHAIAHRDIKPDNVMLMPSGQVKLVDFGHAIQMSDARDPCDYETTWFLRVMGTSLYLPPELEDDPTGSKHYNPFAHDAWCYGMLLQLLWDVDNDIDVADWRLATAYLSVYEECLHSQPARRLPLCRGVARLHIAMRATE